MRELTIKICGHAGSGKSLLAELIRKQLAANGFTDVRVQDDEISEMVDFQFDKRLESVAANVSVVIETVQLARPGYVNKDV